RRQKTAQRLRKDDVDHALPEGEPDRLGGLGLPEMDGLNGAARDLDHLRCSEEGESRHRRDEVAEIDPERGEAIVDGEDQDNDRYAANDVAVDADGPTQRRRSVRENGAERNAEQK